MSPQSMVMVLAPAGSPSSHSKHHMKQTLASRPQRNPYPSDSEDSSFIDSESESECSENESPIPNAKPGKPHRGISQTSARPAKQPASQNVLPAPAAKPYVCSHVGCGKSYRKPSRLQEHERSHTGERPFVCSECGKSYLRDSHLRAHSRSHLPASARPFVCTHEIVAVEPQSSKSELIPTQHAAETSSTEAIPSQPCGQRFWTPQHLQAHELAIHRGEKPYKCTLCSLAFNKHGALQLHIADIHSPPGTKPYRCEHTGCTQSFATNQKLKMHAKVHDVTRYACAHPDCSNDDQSIAVQFSTWSLLQEHMRSVHPPKCPYPACHGRTFTSSKGLRGHLKTHRDHELEAAYAAQSSEVSHKRTFTDVDSATEAAEPPSKRRRGGEVGRDWLCPIDDCNKSFKSKKAQQDHVRVSHEGQRKFACPKDGCEKTFGYKHVMQRHLERHHRLQEDDSVPSQSASTHQKDSIETTHIIDLLTGQDYDESPRSPKTNATRPRVINCPWPDAFETGRTSGDNALLATEIRAKCAFRFSRAYDLRRHLRSAHGLEVDADEVSAWVSEHKRTESSNVTN